MSSSPYAGQCLHNGALSVIDVAKSTNVNLGLDLQTLPSWRP